MLPYYSDSDILCCSDDSGRYAYDKQPEICKWNLEKLAEALSPLISRDQTDPVLETYDEHFNKYYQEKMMKKVTISQCDLS